MKWARIASVLFGCIGICSALLLHGKLPHNTVAGELRSILKAVSPDSVMPALIILALSYVISILVHAVLNLIGNSVWVRLMMAVVTGVIGYGLGVVFVAIVSPMYSI